MMKKNDWLWLVVLLLAGLAFWYGGRDDNLISRVVFPPSPTPTPDPRGQLGEKRRVDGMDLSLVSAWRIVRPNEIYDLGILEVKFAGTSECNKAEETGGSLCRFERGSFQLMDSEGNQQQTAPAKFKYIPGMRYIQLAPSRELIKSTSEQGQLYFLLSKDVNDFTLVYESARVKVEPVVYGRNEAIRNLTATPHPEYGVVE